MGFRFQFLPSSRTVFEQKPTSSLQTLQRQLGLRLQWPGQLFDQMNALHSQTQCSTLRFCDSSLLFTFLFILSTVSKRNAGKLSLLYTLEWTLWSWGKSLWFDNYNSGYHALLGRAWLFILEKVHYAIRSESLNPCPCSLYTIRRPYIFCSWSPWLGSPTTRFPVYTGVVQPACELAGSHSAIYTQDFAHQVIILVKKVRLFANTFIFWS
jgi:hypothetical protein